MIVAIYFYQMLSITSVFLILAGKIKREKKIQELSSSSINLSVENPNKINSSQAEYDADPGVISDDDDFAVNITVNQYPFVTCGLFLTHL